MAAACGPRRGVAARWWVPGRCRGRGGGGGRGAWPAAPRATAPPGRHPRACPAPVPESPPRRAAAGHPLPRGREQLDGGTRAQAAGTRAGAAGGGRCGPQALPTRGAGRIRRPAQRRIEADPDRRSAGETGSDLGSDRRRESGRDFSGEFGGESSGARGGSSEPFRLLVPAGNPGSRDGGIRVYSGDHRSISVRRNEQRRDGCHRPLLRTANPQAAGVNCGQPRHGPGEQPGGRHGR